MRITDLGSARQRFDAAQGAVRQLKGIEQQLEALRSCEGVGGVSYDERVRGSGLPSDPMAATDRRIDSSEELYVKRDAARAIVQLCRSELVWAAQRAGTFPADVVRTHWLEDLSWRATAKRVGCSLSWAQSCAELVFTLLDERDYDALYGEAYDEALAAAKAL